MATIDQSALSQHGVYSPPPSPTSAATKLDAAIRPPSAAPSQASHPLPAPPMGLSGMRAARAATKPVPLKTATTPTSVVAAKPNTPPPSPFTRPRPPPLLLSLQAFSQEADVSEKKSGPISPSYPFPSSPRRTSSTRDQVSPRKTPPRRPSLLQPGSARSNYFNLDFGFLDDAPPPPGSLNKHPTAPNWASYSLDSSKWTAAADSTDESSVDEDMSPEYRRPSVASLSGKMPFPSRRPSSSPSRSSLPTSPTKRPPYLARNHSYSISDSSDDSSAPEADVVFRGTKSPSRKASKSSATNGSVVPSTEPRRPSDVEKYLRVAEFVAETAAAMEGEIKKSEAEDVELSVTGVEAPKASTEDLPKMYEKRRRAIEELLETEAVYASDMVVVRDIYIARAKGADLTSVADHVMRLGLGLGQTEFAEPSPPLDPSMPRARRPSLRHTPCGSGVPLSKTAVPIMSSANRRDIFRNLDAIATFAETFSGLLDGAFAGGAAGSEEDCVGEVFLSQLPQMQELYSTYCAGHSLALARLQELDPTLRTYFGECKALSSGRTKAWDLVSLFIKPVQRVLKYHLLLQQILSGTPSGHPSRPNLELAFQKMLVVAEHVNRSQKTATVAGPNVSKSEASRTDGNLSTFGLSVTKKLLRPPSRDKEAGQQERNNMFDTLAALVGSTRDNVVRFTNETKDWSRNTRVGLEAQAVMVDGWIEISALNEAGSPQSGGRYEQLCQFMDDVIGPVLDGPADDLDNEIRRSLLLKSDHLLSLFDNPLKAIAYRNELLRDHTRYTLRKSPSDRANSEEFLTLTSQLLDELPKFLDNVSRYFNIIISGLASAQATYHAAILALWKPFETRWAPDASSGTSTPMERRPLLPMLAVGLGISSYYTSEDSPRSGRSTPTSFRRRPRATSPYPASISSPTRSSFELKPPGNRQSRLSASSTERPTFSRGNSFTSQLQPTPSSLVVPHPSSPSSSLGKGEPLAPEVLYMAEAVSKSTPGQILRRGNHPVLSFEIGDQLAVEREEADTDEGGAGWLLGQTSKGEYGWVRSEGFGKLE